MIPEVANNGLAAGASRAASVADTHRMDASDFEVPSLLPSPGMHAVVTRRGSWSPVGEGTFSSRFGMNLTLEPGPGFLPLTPGDAVVVTCGMVGQRLGVLAEFKESRGSTVVFRRRSAWHAVDTRVHPRYAARFEVEVSDAGGRFAGTVTDISRGGLALRAERSSSDAALRVRFDLGAGRALELPCEAVRRGAGEEACRFHLSFGELPAEAREAVDGLVARLMVEFEEQLLAG